MFTGLIAETGTVVSLEKNIGVTRIRVAAPTLAKQLGLGDSIAVSGVCLTALNITPESFEADLLEETIRRTSLSKLAPGSKVNLELPTPAGTP
ncbi:MAG TPA: riboflavin synthase, partial [Terriglobus sp.]